MVVDTICVGLPVRVPSMDDAAAAEMVDRVTAVHDVVRTPQDEGTYGRGTKR